MERKSNEEICLFVRDEQTSRFLFNAKALQALGINPVEPEQRGALQRPASPTCPFAHA